MNANQKAKIILILQGLLMVFITIAPGLEKGGFDFTLWPMAINKIIGVSLNIVGFVLLVMAISTM